MAEPAGTRLYLMAPVEIEVGREYESLWDEIRAAGYVRDPRRRRHATRSTSRRRSTAAASTTSKSSSTASSSAPMPARGSPDSVENALALGKGVIRVAYAAATTCPKPAGRSARPQPAPGLRALRPQLRAADAAQLLVQQPAGLVPSRAKGWASQSARIRPRCSAIPKLTLAEGAVALWPDLEHRVSQQMLRSLAARHRRARSTCPFDQLGGSPSAAS